MNRIFKCRVDGSEWFYVSALSAIAAIDSVYEKLSEGRHKVEIVYEEDLRFDIIKKGGHVDRKKNIDERVG